MYFSAEARVQLKSANLRVSDLKGDHSHSAIYKGCNHEQPYMIGPIAANHLNKKCKANWSK